MPDQRNMLDQTKMTAPIPAVGAAGEQSENKKSNDIIRDEQNRQKEQPTNRQTGIKRA